MIRSPAEMRRIGARSRRKGCRGELDTAHTPAAVLVGETCRLAGRQDGVCPASSRKDSPPPFKRPAHDLPHRPRFTPESLTDDPLAHG